MVSVLSAIIVAQVSQTPPSKPTETSAVDRILASEIYVKPPQAILDSVLAPWNKNVSVSNLDPNRENFLNIDRPLLVPIAILGRPTRILGGMEVDVRGHRNKDMVNRGATSVDVISIRSSAKVVIKPDFPLGISNPEWSHKGDQVAFWGFRDSETLLCVADVATGRVRIVTREKGQPTLVTGLNWVNDDREIVGTFAPQDQKPMPAPPEVADRPLVRVSDKERNSLRTYQGLLTDEYDAQLLDYFATTQLVRVDVGSGRVTRIGKPAAYRSVNPSPDGKAFWVTTMDRPYSYLVPMSSFGSTTKIIDEDGRELIAVSKTNLRLPTPGAGGPQGGGGGQAAGRNNDRRAMAWRPDGAGLSYLQLEPEDKDNKEQRRKDRVMLWKYPFGANDAEVVYEDETAIGSVQYTKNPRKLVISQTKDGKSVTTLVDLDDAKNNKVLIERSAGQSGSPQGRGGGRPQADDDDGAGQTGSLIQREGPRTGSIVQLSNDENAVFFSGTIPTKSPRTDAPRPWIDRLDLSTNVRTRIFESRSETYESAVGVDNDMSELLVTRQSRSRVPDTYLVNRITKSERAVTSNRDYNPDLTQADMRIVDVTRADGMRFEVRVYLPKGFQTGDKRPTFFWFYPGEFVDQAAYDRTKQSGNPNLFRRISASSPLHFLKLGYVVVEPDCPIFAPADRKNDGFIPQLRNNLSATIDTLSEQGLIDRRRLALGGHSYGAFSTANAMVHTPYFKAGIAGDGAYNRSLTPFGFQSEQRMLWESREVYLTMSPMLWAEQMTGALLMYHGIEDQNMGTWPLNSERMFAALEALGKPSALYMYPYEDHGQIAEETRLDMWARWVAWLQKWLEDK